MDGHLVISGITIEETIEALTSQLLQDLVNERERKVILSSDRVQLPIVDTHSPSRGGTSRYQLALVILHDSEPGFLGNNLY